MPLLETAIQTTKTLLIIVDDVDGEALTTVDGEALTTLVLQL